MLQFDPSVKIERMTVIAVIIYIYSLKTQFNFLFETMDFK